MTTSEKSIVGLGSQISVAVAEPVGSPEPHSIVILAGQEIIGGVVSVTLIDWSQLAELPEQSVAVQVRVIRLSPVHEFPVTTSENVIIGFASQTSVAVAEPVTEGSEGSPHSTDAFAGQLMGGGVVSVTFIVWSQLEELPEQSVAVQVRIMALSPVQDEPEAASVKLISGFGSQASVAVAEPVTDGSFEAPHSTVAVGGQMIGGGVVS